MFRQYIPGKRHKYGIKLYMLCEPTGYVWNLRIYSGKSDPISGLGHAESVVMKLMEGRLDCGHVVYVDNFYTSIPLAEQLLRRKTHLCGTLRRNRKQLPATVVSAKLKPGEIISRRQGSVAVTKWADKRDILMLSTLHDGKIVECPKLNRRRNKVKKPDCIIDYNQFMCGVDRMDQLISYYTPLRKTLKWYRKVVLQLIDFAAVNAFLIYKKVGGRKRQKWFRKEIITSLLMCSNRPEKLSVQTSSCFSRNKSEDLSRLSGQHFLDLIPATESKSAPHRKCIVCHKKGRRRETKYVCKVCFSKPALCVVPCFEIYHSSVEF